MKMNIYLAGVGGQGLITFATVLGEAALRAGLNVIVAETHGLSQRGGSVDVHVRLGDVEAPLIPLGGADAVVAFEILEAFRALKYANKETLILVNRRVIRPPGPGVKIPDLDYLESRLLEASPRVRLIDAYGQALKLGDVIFENMVMLGALYASTQLKDYIAVKDIEEAIREVIGKAVEKNIEAFRVGARLING